MLRENFLIPPEVEETDESSDVKEPEAVDLQEEEGTDLEVLEISLPKVQEVLIVLDEDEDKAGFDRSSAQSEMVSLFKHLF